METPLSREELGALTAQDLQQFDKPELHVVTESVRTEAPHPHRPLAKWEKCWKRDGRVATYCTTEACRRNVRRILTIAKLPSPPDETIPQRARRKKVHSEIPLPPHSNGVLRGGLNHDGPLIPDDIADAVLPPAERSLETLFDSLGYDL